MKIKRIIIENNLQGVEEGRTIKIIEADEITSHPTYSRGLMGGSGNRSGYTTVTESEYTGKLPVGYRRDYGCRK